MKKKPYQKNITDTLKMAKIKKVKIPSTGEYAEQWELCTFVVEM